MSIITDTIYARGSELSQRALRRIRERSGSPDGILDQWELYEDGHEYDLITAETAEEALEEARQNVDDSNYSIEPGKTLYIDVRVRNAVTGEEASDTVTIEPDEPECSADSHDWQSPYSVLGGIEENPGVWGHGGGVIMKQLCSHCGVYRTTDTWAQRRDTGEQGLTEISYSEADDASERWINRRKLTDAAESVG